MKDKHRKVKPQPPHWAELKGEACWDCPNKNGCGSCKQAKVDVAYQKEKYERRMKIGRI